MRRDKPPFRADHVGSVLRPKRLLDARERHAAGQVSDEELKAAEDDAIRDVVRMQEEVGLQSATDGVFRRAAWHMDFIYSLDGISKVEGGDIVVQFHNPDAGVFALNDQEPCSWVEPVLRETEVSIGRFGPGQPAPLTAPGGTS